jgi:hypothetical protein
MRTLLILFLAMAALGWEAESKSVQDFTSMYSEMFTLEDAQKKDTKLTRKKAEDEAVIAALDTEASKDTFIQEKLDTTEAFKDVVIPAEPVKNGRIRMAVLQAMYRQILLNQPDELAALEKAKLQAKAENKAKRIQALKAVVTAKSIEPKKEEVKDANSL